MDVMAAKFVSETAGVMDLQACNTCASGSGR